MLCVAGLTAIPTQVRCIDAAREAARLAARGDSGDAVQAARGIAPAQAVVDVRNDGDTVVATVSARSILLAGVTLRAVAVAAIEPAAG